jgi:hypothetical protein
MAHWGGGGAVAPKTNKQSHNVDENKVSVDNCVPDKNADVGS